jgi:hypothetical protein
LIEGFGSREHVAHVDHIRNIPLPHRLIEGSSSIKHAEHALNIGYIPAIQSLVEGWKAGKGEQHVSDARHIPAVKDVSIGQNMWMCIPVIFDGLLKASSIWEIWDWNPLGVETTPRCILHLCANEATDHAVEAASEELIIFSLYFLQLPNNSELKQLLLGLFWQL